MVPVGVDFICLSYTAQGFQIHSSRCTGYRRLWYSHPPYSLTLSHTHTHSHMHTHTHACTHTRTHWHPHISPSPHPTHTLTHSCRIHMPSVTYLRLDGSIVPSSRFEIVHKWVQEVYSGEFAVATEASWPACLPELDGSSD